MSDRHGQQGRQSGWQLAVAVVLLVSLSGCGDQTVAGESMTGPPSTNQPEENATMEPATSAPTALECGRPLRKPASGRLTLTGRFPAVVRSTERILSGTVEVTSADVGVAGVVTPTADAFLVRDGRIVTLPVPQDSVGKSVELGPGTVETLQGEVSLSPCQAGLGGSLGPGTYDLYVRVVLNNDDGTMVESVGGPWPLDVR
jgi:hypothetical protein